MILNILPVSSDFIPLGDIVDGNAVAIETPFVKVANAMGFCFLINANKGAAGQKLVVTLEQAKTGAGDAKALDIMRIYHKAGAAAANLAPATDVWSRIKSVDELEPISSLDTATQAIANADVGQLCLCLHVDSSDLDMNGGYGLVRVKIAQITGATPRLVAVNAVPTQTNYSALGHKSLLA